MDACPATLRTWAFPRDIALTWASVRECHVRLGCAQVGQLSSVAASPSDHGIDPGSRHGPRTISGDEQLPPIPIEGADRSLDRDLNLPGGGRHRTRGRVDGAWPTRNSVPPRATQPPSAAPSPRPTQQRVHTGRPQGRTRPRRSPGRKIGLDPVDALGNARPDGIGGRRMCEGRRGEVDRGHPPSPAQRARARRTRGRSPRREHVPDEDRRARRSDGRSAVAAPRHLRARAGHPTSALPRSDGSYSLISAQTTVLVIGGDVLIEVATRRPRQRWAEGAARSSCRISRRDHDSTRHLGCASVRECHSGRSAMPLPLGRRQPRREGAMA